MTVKERGVFEERVFIVFIRNGNLVTTVRKRRRNGKRRRGISGLVGPTNSMIRAGSSGFASLVVVGLAQMHLGSSLVSGPFIVTQVLFN